MQKKARWWRRHGEPERDGAQRGRRERQQPQEVVRLEEQVGQQVQKVRRRSGENKSQVNL